MTTNIEIEAIDSTVIVYLNDGTTHQVHNTRYFVQLPDFGYCTILDAGAAENGHQPQKFAAQMIEYWNKFWKVLEQEEHDHA